MAEMPFVSVIIPVLNSRGRVGACLDALGRQTYSRDRYEVIVVDNGSTDGTLAEVQQYPFVRVLAESRRGSYAARNCGIAAATGDIVAFIDSDCTPDTAWLTEGVRCLQEDPRIGLVAGRVEVYPEVEGKPSPAEIYELCFAFPQEAYVRRSRFGATANVFTRAVVFGDVGLFDGSLESGGDRQWGHRVAMGGWGLRYCNAALVRHPARRNWAELEEKMRRVFRGRKAQGALMNSWQWTILLWGILTGFYHILRTPALRTSWKLQAIMVLVRIRFLQRRLCLQMMSRRTEI